MRARQITVLDECRWLHQMGYSSQAAPTGTTFGVYGTSPTNHCPRAPRLSRELKLLEVVVEVERRRVVDVLRILPISSRLMPTPSGGRRTCS